MHKPISLGHIKDTLCADIVNHVRHREAWERELCIDLSAIAGLTKEDVLKVRAALRDDGVVELESEYGRWPYCHGIAVEVLTTQDLLKEARAWAAKVAGAIIKAISGATRL